MQGEERDIHSVSTEKEDGQQHKQADEDSRSHTVQNPSTPPPKSPPETTEQDSKSSVGNGTAMSNSTPPSPDQKPSSSLTPPTTAAANTSANSSNANLPSSATSTSTTSSAASSPSSQRKRIPTDFEFGHQLGEGSYSTVVYAKELSTSREFAVKILDKKHIIKEKKVKYVQIEKEVLNRINHPFIVKLFYTFQDAYSLYFVLEYVRNGDLLGYIRKMGSFDLTCARFYIAEIVDAIEHLHENNIIHRDLKPENILINHKMHIKITDFGSAKIMDGADTQPAEPASSDSSPRKKRNSFVGTAEYCSPELLNDRAVSPASDVWAIGCILYQLLAGRPPFKGSNEYQTFQKIIKQEYDFPNGFPEAAADLIRKILVANPEERLTTTEAKKHAFFDGFDWTDLHKQTPPTLKPFLPAITAHNAEDLRSDIEDGNEDEVDIGGEDEPTITTDASRSRPTSSLPQPTSSAATPTSSHPPGGGDSSNNSSDLDQARTALLQTQRQTSPYAPLLQPTELILRTGKVYKRKGLFAKRRTLVLTDLPRLMFVDDKRLGVGSAPGTPPNTHTHSGTSSGNGSGSVDMSAVKEVPWSEKLQVEYKNATHFFVHTPKRTYYIEGEGAREWVEA
ncbi:3-phosphoinositide dependent protein kinase-1, partial [Quaeritorhiza haematococci]